MFFPTLPRTDTIVFWIAVLLFRELGEKEVLLMERRSKLSFPSKDLLLPSFSHDPARWLEQQAMIEGKGLLRKLGVSEELLQEPYVCTA